MKKDISISSTQETGDLSPKGRKKAPGPRIYVGPGFKGVIHGTVYQNALSPILEEAIRVLPAIGELVVPVEQLPQINRELASPNSALHRIYQMATDYKKED